MGRFEHEVVNRSHILRLHGEFMTDDDRDASVLTEAIVGCHTTQTPCVVVNWAGTTRWTSIGIGGLITGERKILTLGGHYWNCALARQAKDLLLIIKPIGFAWNLKETEAEAVRACPQLTKSRD